MPGSAPRLKRSLGWRRLLAGCRQSSSAGIWCPMETQGGDGSQRPATMGELGAKEPWVTASDPTIYGEAQAPAIRLTPRALRKAGSCWFLMSENMGLTLVPA